MRGRGAPEAISNTASGDCFAPFRGSPRRERPSGRALWAKPSGRRPFGPRPSARGAMTPREGFSRAFGQSVGWPVHRINPMPQQIRYVQLDFSQRCLRLFWALRPDSPPCPPPRCRCVARGGGNPGGLRRAAKPPASNPHSFSPFSSPFRGGEGGWGDEEGSGYDLSPLII